VKDNAVFVERVSKEHGGFGKFLAKWPADDQIGLMAFFAKQGSRLGGNTGQYLLRWLGWDAFIISPDMAAALRDAGLDIAETPTSKADQARIQAQVNDWVQETGLGHAQVSRILAMSTGNNYTPEQIREYTGE
jgi:3-methyladenine DNA glycosylase Tag